MYNVPIIIVLTQSYSKREAKEMLAAIKKEELDVVNIIPVLAEDYEFAKKRLFVVAESIPEIPKERFRKQEKLCLWQKTI